MSGTLGALRLIELTSARLCHDISSLAGSLDNAVAAPSNGSPSARARGNPAVSAARILTITLKLRLAAWGTGDGEPLSLTDMRHLAEGLPAPVAVDASALDHATVFSPPAGRIVLNLLLLAADSLPSGGTIILAGAADDLFIRIAGSGSRWPVGLAVCLSDEAEARSALTERDSLQMALTALLAHAAGIRLSLLLAPTARKEPAILRLGG